MGNLGPETDPFVAIGFTSDFSNVVVHALKRGKNGEGYGINVLRKGRPDSSIEPQDGQLLGEVVDRMSGEGAAASVAVLVHDILKRNGEV